MVRELYFNNAVLKEQKQNLHSAVKGIQLFPTKKEKKRYHWIFSVVDAEMHYSEPHLKDWRIYSPSCSGCGRLVAHSKSLCLGIAFSWGYTSSQPQSTSHDGAMWVSKGQIPLLPLRTPLKGHLSSRATPEINWNCITAQFPWLFYRYHSK